MQQCAELDMGVLLFKSWKASTHKDGPRLQEVWISDLSHCAQKTELFSIHIAFLDESNWVCWNLLSLFWIHFPQKKTSNRCALGETWRTVCTADWGLQWFWLRNGLQTLRRWSGLGARIKLTTPHWRCLPWQKAFRLSGLWKITNHQKSKFRCIFSNLTNSCAGSRASDEYRGNLSSDEKGQMSWSHQLVFTACWRD